MAFININNWFVDNKKWFIDIKKWFIDIKKCSVCVYVCVHMYTKISSFALVKRTCLSQRVLYEYYCILQSMLMLAGLNSLGMCVYVCLCVYVYTKISYFCIGKMNVYVPTSATCIVSIYASINAYVRRSTLFCFTITGSNNAYLFDCLFSLGSTRTWFAAY